MIGIINAHMMGATSEPGEYVDWSEPDVMTERDAEFLLGDVAAYAASNPHMIIFEVES
jgi:hypothetical protein